MGVGRHGGDSARGRIEAVLIAGPTASGKSALAVRVASRIGGAVVNADSMQVYRDLHVLSARPTDEEMAGVPHRLYGHVDGAVNYSVGHWMADMAAELQRLKAEGLLPVIVGGTGLYFKALTEGLSPMPAVPAMVRMAVREEAAGHEAPALHRLLAERDPAMAARLRPSDSQRILRALEVLAATGRSLAEWQDAPRVGALLEVERVRAVFLDVDRETLKARIDARFNAMMAAGALDEVKALHGRGLDPVLPVMRAHGVPGLVDHIEGRCTLDEAVARGQRDTRAYAKRQVTWFRHQGAEFEWVAGEAGRETFLDTVAR